MDNEDLLHCQFCWQGAEVEHIAGRLHAEKTDCGKLICAHHRCMQYASGLTQYRCHVFGGFDIAEVQKEIGRGQKLRCFLCKGSRGRKSRGASCGCAVKFCRKSFHFTCASIDPTTLTKRLVVAKDKPLDRSILYRVFCSSAHEEIFRKTLKEDLRVLSRKKPCTKTPDSASGHEMMVDKEQNCSVSGRQGAVTAASLNTSQLPTESCVVMASLDVFSPPMAGSKDEEHALMSTEDSDDASMQDSVLWLPSITSSSTALTGGGSEGTMPEGSKPLLCPLTEELTSKDSGGGRRKEGGAGGKRKEGSDVKNKKTGDCGQDEDELEAHVRRCSKGGDFGTAPSPGQESVENKSPNIPPHMSDTLMKAVTVCLYTMENGLVIPAHIGNTTKAAVGHSGNTTKDAVGNSGNTTKDAVGNSGNTTKDAVGNSGNTTKAAVGNMATAKAQTAALANSKWEARCDRAAIRGKEGTRATAGKLRVGGGGQAGSCGSESLGVGGQASSAGSQHSQAEDSGCQSQGEGGASQESCTVGQQAQEVEAGAPLRAQKMPEGKSESDSSTECRSSASASRHRTKRCGGHKGGSSKKQKRSESGFYSADDGAGKSRDNIIEQQQAECVLLIPCSLEDFESQEQEVRQAVCGGLKVEGGQVYVWQVVTLRSLPPSLMLLFLLDLVREMRQGNHQAVLDLLFNGDCLTSKANNYLLAQAQVAGEDKLQQEVEASMWRGLERTVESLPAVRLIHGLHGLATLALDGRCYQLGHHIKANIQAYTGLFGWTNDTEASTFPLSPSEQRLAVQSEALALKTWLTQVNPVSEVTVLPSDELLFDRADCEANREFLSLAGQLKATSHAAVLVEDWEGGSGAPLQRVVPLLIFQPVEVFLLNFQDYFFRACDDFFRTRGLVNVLVLLPLSNLYSGKGETIASLLRGGNYRVSVFSAFCPASLPTSMVLLEVTVQDAPTAQVDSIDSMIQLTLSGDQSIENTTGDQSTHNTTGDQSTHNTTGDQSTHNTTGDQLTHNTTGDQSTHNTTGDQSTHNTTGDQSTYNTTLLKKKRGRPRKSSKP